MAARRPVARLPRKRRIVGVTSPQRLPPDSSAIVTPPGRGPWHCTDSVVFVAWSLGGIPSPCWKIKASVSMISSNTLATGLVWTVTEQNQTLSASPTPGRICRHCRVCRRLRQKERIFSYRAGNRGTVAKAAKPLRLRQFQTFSQLSESYCRRRPCRSYSAATVQPHRPTGPVTVSDSSHSSATGPGRGLPTPQ